MLFGVLLAALSLWPLQQHAQIQCPRPADVFSRTHIEGILTCHAVLQCFFARESTFCNNDTSKTRLCSFEEQCMRSVYMLRERATLAWCSSRAARSSSLGMLVVKGPPSSASGVGSQCSSTSSNQRQVFFQRLSFLRQQS